MQFSLYILCIVSHSLNVVHSKRWSTAHEILELISVSRFQGVDKYYCQLKEKSITKEDTRLITVSPKEDVAIRQRICKNIFRSSYFEYKREKVVNVKKARIQNELKLNYPRTYDKMYIESRIASRFPIRRHYDNPYTLRTVFVPGYPVLLKEYVFMCPVREYQSNKIKEYYISPQYNVNDAANYFNATTHITGRFIFQPSPKSGILVVYALAEESAKGVLTFNIDLFYFLKRGYNSPAERAIDDPICKLSNVEKLRLCTTLFSSYPYVTKVKFVPGMDSVEVECQKREIKFFTDVQWDQHFNSTAFYEWMFVCKAVTIKNGKWINFYVSGGYGPNRVFVYKEHTKGKLLLYHHSVNIGAVKE